MEQKDLEYFKTSLANQLSELLRQGDDTVSGMKDDMEPLPDPADRASFEADRNFLLRIRDRESKLIKKIKKTLQNIEEGSFGICEQCEEEIGIARLKARPVTTLCIECKNKQETMEKVAGI